MQCRIIFFYLPLTIFQKFIEIIAQKEGHFDSISDASSPTSVDLLFPKKMTKSFYRVFVKSMERVIWNNKRVKLYRATVCCSNQRDLENKLIQDIYVIIQDFQFASGAETGHNRKMLQTNVCQDRVRAPTFLSGDVQKLCCGTSWTLCKYS